MDDHGPPLRGRDHDNQEGRHHNQYGTPGRPAAAGTRPQPRPVTVPDRPLLKPLPHPRGEVPGWRYLKIAAHRPQLGLRRLYPPDPVSH